MAIPANHLFAADSLIESKKQLEEVKKKIDTTAKKIQHKQANERSALSRLENINSRINASNRNLRQTSKHLAELKEKISETQKSSSQYESILKQAKKDLEKRLGVLYATADNSILRLIFSDASPAIIAENAEFLRRITAHDKALMLRYRTQVKSLNASKEALLEQKQEYANILKQQKQQKIELEQTQQQQDELVKEIRRDTRMLNSVLEDLKNRSTAMQKLVESLELKQQSIFIPSGSAFKSLKGKLHWPSSGAVRSGFGVHKHKQFGSQVKTNGLEIAALPGTKVHAIWEGKVVFAAPFKGYGNMLILDHGNKYYSLYANMAQINVSKGDIIPAGEDIALAGFNNNDSYYFEIRHQGTPLNPADWLMPRAY